jgi:hypothetical protein
MGGYFQVEPEIITNDKPYIYFESAEVIKSINSSFRFHGVNDWKFKYLSYSELLD